MSRITKLIILIIISFSVYFIYQDTKGKTITILNIGDGLAVGINSYGIKEYGYIDYYRDYLNKEKNVTVINEYAKRYLSIDKLLSEIKTNSKLKRDLSEAHQLILSVGYNDLKYRISIENNITETKINKMMMDIEKKYNDLIKEIRKYYKNEIITIGYYNSNDYYLNYSIKLYNNILRNNKETIYISTEKLYKNFNMYFSNPKSYYPNRLGYEEIAKKIIRKTLEKKENI